VFVTQGLAKLKPTKGVSVCK